MGMPPINNGSRPSYEYVNPEYLNTLFNCIKAYSDFRTYLNYKMMKTSSRIEWYVLLRTAFMFIRGHLCAEKENHKHMLSEMTDWSLGTKNLSDDELGKYMHEIITYYHELGLTKVEVITDKYYNSLK